MRLNRIKFKGGIRYLLLSCVIVMGLISIIATGGDDDGGVVGGGTGTLSINMTDSITDELDQVWVTIEEVSVHKSVDEENAGDEQNNGANEGEETASWEVLEGANVGTYDLLELVNGKLVELVTGELEAGHYTQIRLLLGVEEPYEGTNSLGNEHPFPNYVVTKDNEGNPVAESELQISSQDETGIKLIKGFDIESGVVTELILDWDTEKSIIKMPNGEYKLKPTIKILEALVSSTISGTVTDDSEEPIEGALVTSQVVDSEGNLVSVGSSTTTDANGEYMLNLEELEEDTNYNIVVYKEGYSPECRTINYDELESPTDITDGNFTLTSVDTGTISGLVTIEGGAEDQSVDISIRQSGDCGEIEIAFENVANGVEYSITLPEGIYTLVASTEGYDTKTYDVTIDSEDPATQDLEFKQEI